MEMRRLHIQDFKLPAEILPCLTFKNFVEFLEEKINDLKKELSKIPLEIKELCPMDEPPIPLPELLYKNFSILIGKDFSDDRCVVVLRCCIG